MTEIKDCRTDREALALILDALGQPEAIDTERDSVHYLDFEWRRQAMQLYRMTDDGFTAFQVRLLALAGGSWDGRKAVGRAHALVSYVVDARHSAWREAEIAAGRDPDRPA
ncbi:hypothetical protein [Brevundimonas goettingensis]|uniref:Uncharacterized protein n=1 Tax=Brevundimonas goettingensis TaxID=2774190 RepID=A0A975C5J5_9CAUL|nr:hypothetical protein [Brevundimonas goettingensis]QTC92854.1 hypothetical protein IFJ75_08430 [Brevundimonas goettingensis]